MFNVPRELLPDNHPLNLLPKVPPGGFQAFSVKDDLSTSAEAKKPETTSASAKAETPASTTLKHTGETPAPQHVQTPAPQSEKIPIEIASDVNPRQYWDNYFAAHAPQPAAVREAVRQLMKKQKYEHVIALIGAALRSRQAQPWMYEAMSLAMQAAGRPKQEIERVVMSSVDFCNNAGDLTYIGAYLMQLGLNQRALDLFRQAAQQDPLRSEPYMLGLKAARELNDLDGLRWASLGILSQAWGKDQDQVWQSGVGVAKELIERLKLEKGMKAAQAFLAELDQAVVRDCVVAVHWTGDAEVDLMVQEPTGTVCSLRNPRTTAGGVMLGEAVSQTASDNSGGHSEVYVCPKGFDGTYRLKAWRVWGKVTTGKVTVEITSHFRDKMPVRVSQKIPLENDEALAMFDLKGGRRKESLRQEQVANAAGEQLALNQQILAQQIAASIDPGAMSSILADRSSAASGEGVNGAAGNGAVGFVPFVPRGAVGYQPVIVPLPAGASMSAVAVVSADRRYVRITFPQNALIFSAIGDVTTFNIATGATSTGSGQSGSSGFSGFGGGGGGGGGSGTGSF